VRLVGGPDVHDVERVRRRRNVREVELGHLGHRRENVVQLNAEPLDLLVVELEAREARDVEQLFAVDSHSFGNLSRRDEAPCRGPRNARVPTVL